MILNLRPLFTGECDVLPIQYNLDLSHLKVGETIPFSGLIEVTGQAVCAVGIVTLRLTASYTYVGACDRCAADFSRRMTVPIEHILVTSLEEVQSDEYVLVENDQVSLDELLEADLLLSLPLKWLCRPDCRGLCPHCGQNLNEGLCGCGQKETDPRLAVLQQWITNG